MILARRRAGRVYDGRPLADEEVRRPVEALVVRADTLQFFDPAWQHEPAEWRSPGVLPDSSPSNLPAVPAVQPPLVGG